MNNLVSSLILIVLGISNALADIVTKCDAPKGYSYFIEGKLIQKKEAGWSKDGISNGYFIVTRDKEGSYDIIFNDVTKRTISSREDGGEIVVVSKSNEHLVLVVAYPDLNIETWFFKINQNGMGELSMSQARYGDAATMNKHSLMIASCSK